MIKCCLQFTKITIQRLIDSHDVFLSVDVCCDVVANWPLQRDKAPHFQWYIIFTIADLQTYKVYGKTLTGGDMK